VPPGVTAKLAPLALVPNNAPPVRAVYQLMVLPAEVAFNCEVAPAQIEVGVAVTGEGDGVTVFTVTVTGVRVGEAQATPVLVQDRITWPLPVRTPWVWVTPEVPAPVKLLPPPAPLEASEEPPP
jgi:hypothetical protein